MDRARPFEAMSNPHQLFEERKMECRRSIGCENSPSSEMALVLATVKVKQEDDKKTFLVV
uniref:Uncharacterized protein n=1 Tax=Oryza rufipogon TaxID=4529 RepID=A0A0E0QAL1_ORYRU